MITVSCYHGNHLFMTTLSYYHNNITMISNQIKSFIHHQLDIYNMHECSNIITSYSGNFQPDTYNAFNPGNLDCVEKAEHNQLNEIYNDTWT
jgi:hypothetical protein